MPSTVQICTEATAYRETLWEIDAPLPEVLGLGHFTPLVARSQGHNENQVSIMALARRALMKALHARAASQPLRPLRDYLGSTSDLEGSWGPLGT